MQPKVKRYYDQKIKPLLVILFLIILLGTVVKIGFVVYRFMDDTGLSPQTVFRLLVNHGATLQSVDGRTNILVLGIGGGVHDGPDLTDTMIVLSLERQKNRMAFISIPRDIWSDSLKDKINTAYHYGEEKKKGGGMVLAKAEVEDVVGMPIQYGIVVDFSGFKEVIDLVGGVQIHVPSAFSDTEFPITGKENDQCNGDPEYRCRYQTVHFESGSQVMDGERSLTYVRSRHADGDEGSDFARSKRQQELLIALKAKLSSPWLWLSSKQGKILLQALDDATETDLKIGEFLTVGKFMTMVKQDTIQKISIEDLLVSPAVWLYGGRYVLAPMDTWESVHVFIKEKLH